MTTPVPSSSRSPGSPLRSAPASFGDRLRHWRQARHLSQQALAERAELSARHLSFLETGRALPSREMALRLADRLDLPLRERNPLLEAAGYAPMYKSRPLEAPEMGAARRSIDLLLRSHLPNPALVFDRHYRIVASNPMIGLLLQGVAPALLEAPNVIQLSLHPDGLAAHILNYRQVRTHLLERLRRHLAQTGDPVLAKLLDEAIAYPPPDRPDHPDLDDEHPDVLLPLKLNTPAGVLNFVSTVTVFGSPQDITLQELVIESFLAADDATARQLAALAASAYPA